MPQNSRHYRYHLSRSWEPSSPLVAFVMLNPSTADAHQNDPTLRRCIGFARRWGYGRLAVVNLFAYRATNPAVLRQVDDPVGVGNNAVILETCVAADRVVCAWGNHGAYQGRCDVVVDLLNSIPLWCLGTTMQSQPRHPLYVRADVKLKRF